MNEKTKELVEKAQSVLTNEDQNKLEKYIQNGGHELAGSAVAQFFNLYLNGSNFQEIHSLNKAFPYESILWAAVKYNWELKKTEYVINLQNEVVQKVIKAQLETTSLITDVLAAANKKHGTKIKKYLQTGNEADLGDALNVKSLNELMKVGEALQKITGQDRNININKKETSNINVSVSTKEGSNLSPEGAADVLAIVAEEIRKKTGA